MKVIVGVSARHVHLKKEHLDILFGEGYNLTFFKNINQPGQFASNEFVDIKTDKGELKKLRILGPIRNYTQIEISKTDSYKLGVNPPIKTSGDLDSACSVLIIGPKGEVKVDNGIIIANRHIHMSNMDALKLNYKDGQKVKVKVDSEKGGIFDNVYIKTSPEAFFELHIDTDDGNAFMLKSGDEVEIMED